LREVAAAPELAGLIGFKKKLVLAIKCHLNAIHGEGSECASLGKDYRLDNSDNSRLSLSLGLHGTVWKKPRRCSRASTGEGYRTSDFSRNDYEAARTEIIAIAASLSVNIKGKQCQH